MTDTKRPAPPALVFETPPCSLCGEPTEADADAYSCPPCEINWNLNGERGTWYYPTTAQCPAVIRRPLGVIRCHRTAGHGRGHVSPDWIGSGEWEVPGDV